MQLSFGIAEFEDRLARLRGHMAAQKVQVAIIDQPVFVAYIAGYTPSDTRYRALIVPREGEPIFALRALDRNLAETRSWFERIIDFVDWADPVETITEALRSNGWAEGRIGVDLTSYALTVDRFRRYRDLLPDAVFVDLSGVLPELRARKSAAEIALIERAAGIADAAMAAVVAGARIGTTARDAAKTAAAVYLDSGADHGFTGPITIGRGEGFLHALLDDQPLAAGDILHAELVPMVLGYSARLMRPTVVGAATAEQRRVAKALIRLQDRQLAAMRPGAPAAEVDAVLRNSLLAEGLREAVPHTTGYTLGYYGRTGRTSDFGRNFLPTSTWALAAGMTFHMYAAAKGMAFSETVLVTEDGPRRLTRTERRLFEA
jgi:Xaa-Pro dipeptidase